MTELTKQNVSLFQHLPAADNPSRELATRRQLPARPAGTEASVERIKGTIYAELMLLLLPREHSTELKMYVFFMVTGYRIYHKVANHPGPRADTYHHHRLATVCRVTDEEVQICEMLTFRVDYICDGSV